jgi:hypothetical protein
MKKILFVLAVLMLAGVGCPLNQDNDGIISGSSLRPDNYPEAPVGTPPPPSDVVVLIPSTAADSSPLPNGLLIKQHRVGGSPCPDPFPPLILPWPDGQTPPPADQLPTIYPETAAAWLDLPETVTPGQPFTPKFNCRISDRSPHAEEAGVTFRIEGHLGGQPDDVAAELEPMVESYNLPIDVQSLKIRLDVK